MGPRLGIAPASTGLLPCPVPAILCSACRRSYYLSLFVGCWTDASPLRSASQAILEQRYAGIRRRSLFVLLGPAELGIEKRHSVTRREGHECSFRGCGFGNGLDDAADPCGERRDEIAGFAVGKFV